MNGNYARVKALPVEDVRLDDYLVIAGERLRVTATAGNESIIEFLVLDEKGKYRRIKRPRKGLTYVEER